MHTENKAGVRCTKRTLDAPKRCTKRTHQNNSEWDNFLRSVRFDFETQVSKVFELILFKVTMKAYFCYRHTLL